ncbi:MAG TPA: hypothetical protein VFH08_12395 [Chitinophagaceae bacterium]|nr:hypothetical protein [Chitinophagaceae bacterium]
MKNHFILVSICLSFFSCEFSVKTYDKTQNKDSKIRNGIKVNATGVKLEQAFLVKEDGTLLPEDNKIEVKQKIKLRLITNGWMEKEGRVYLDAAQKVIISGGQVIFDQANLFSKDSIESLSVEDAKYINLIFWLNEINELFDFATVEFRLWDKMGEGVVEGSYKVYLK